MAITVRRRFTTEEYHKMGEHGILAEDDRVELIAGEIVEMSPIGPPHAGHVARLNAVLGRLAGDRAIVWVQTPVDLDDYSEPQPDVVLLRPRADFYTTVHPCPADVLLLIEVADSSLDYDRNVKVPLYARAGVPEVWLVDLTGAGRVEVYQNPSGAGYGRLLRPSREDVVPLPGLEGVTLAVADILG